MGWGGGLFGIVTTNPSPYNEYILIKKFFKDAPLFDCPKSEPTCPQLDYNFWPLLLVATEAENI
jgi:hypothetical protein